MKQKKFFGFLIVTALIAIILLGSSPTSAAPFTQSATQTRTATATAVITPTNTTVPPAAPTVVTPITITVPPTATTVVTPTKTSTPVPATATPPKPTATQVVTPTTVKPTATVTPTAVISPTATVTKTVTVTATKTATPTATKAAPTATPTKPNALAPRAGTVAVLSTMFAVQNMDSTTAANVTATFYDPSGSIPVGSGATCSNLQPNRSCIVDQRASNGGLGGQTNWQGSVVLSSNTQLATVVNELAGSYGTLGTDFRMDSYNGVGSSESAMSVLLPQLMKLHLDPDTGKSYNSTIAIQNTSASAPAGVTITYKSRSGTTYVHSAITIQPSSSYIIHLQNESVLPTYDPVQQSAFYGSGTVTSNQPIAVVVNHNAPGVLNAFQGFNIGAITKKKLYFPQVMKNHVDNGYYWSTSLLVMTTAPTANVNVTYTERGTGRVLSSSHVANPAYSFDARYESVLASITDFFGSAVITADQPIIAVVAVWTNPVPNGQTEPRGQRSKYARAFTDGVGTAKVFFPQVWKNALDIGSGLNFGTSAVGQVLSGAPTTVTCTYYLSDGTTRVSTYTTTASDPLFYFDSRYDSQLPNNAIGAAVITTNGQPIAVTGHIFGANFSLVSGDSEGSFSGINGTP